MDFPHQKPLPPPAGGVGLGVLGGGGLHWWNWGRPRGFGVGLSCWFAVGEGLGGTRGVSAGPRPRGELSEQQNTNKSSGIAAAGRPGSLISFPR